MKFNKIFILSAFITTFATTALAQNDEWKLQWHGMVNPVAWWDSRQVVSGREGMMFFYPKPVVKDVNGDDLNGISSLNMLAITARLNLTISGPDIWGAKTKGFIEGDFTGSNETTINCFRLRHAYINMRWTHSEVLAGQYWYPMVIHEIMPNTQPLNMGAPFHPYARYVQARYTHHLGNWEMMGTAAFQLDNKSQGWAGSSTDYLKHSNVPELNAQFRYNGLAEGGPLVGVAYNLSVLHPRDTTRNVAGNTVLATENFASHSFSVFGRYDCPCGWSIRAQALLNNNLYEGCTMGGYIEHLEIANGKYNYDYTPWHFTTVWADISRIKGHWRPGIFIGYGFNNDLDLIAQSSDNAAHYYKVYGRGQDIKNLFRVQPHVGYDTGKGLSLWAELEYTMANYTNSGKADNARLILSAVYAF